MACVISAIKQIKLLITIIGIRERRRTNLKLDLINKIAKYFHLPYTVKVFSFNVFNIIGDTIGDILNSVCRTFFTSYFGNRGYTIANLERWQ